jgi:hypothetical protein
MSVDIPNPVISSKRRPVAIKRTNILHAAGRTDHFLLLSAGELDSKRTCFQIVNLSPFSGINILKHAKTMSILPLRMQERDLRVRKKYKGPCDNAILTCAGSLQPYAYWQVADNVKWSSEQKGLINACKPVSKRERNKIIGELDRLHKKWR